MLDINHFIRILGAVFAQYEADLVIGAPVVRHRPVFGGRPIKIIGSEQIKMPYLLLQRLRDQLRSVLIKLFDTSRFRHSTKLRKSILGKRGKGEEGRKGGRGKGGKGGKEKRGKGQRAFPVPFVPPPLFLPPYSHSRSSFPVPRRLIIHIPQKPHPHNTKAIFPLALTKMRRGGRCGGNVWSCVCRESYRSTMLRRKSGTCANAPTSRRLSGIPRMQAQLQL